MTWKTREIATSRKKITVVVKLFYLIAESAPRFLTSKESKEFDGYILYTCIRVCSLKHVKSSNRKRKREKGEKRKLVRNRG
uniref:Uncharacterized protein n=1 Tax=Trichogramma kaykai TaxID=54128 RepID=A0ABD2WZ17_9HYME